MASREHIEPDSPESIHPALRASVTNVPVTPGGPTEGTSAYIEPGKGVNNSDDNLVKDQEFASGPQGSANSYFAPRADVTKKEPSAEPSTGSKKEEKKPAAGDDSAPKPELVDTDPRVAYPSLNLSGRLISATFCVPYDIGYAPGRDWVNCSPNLVHESRY